MKKFMTAAMAFMCLAAVSFADESLSSTIVQKINDNVFEVVVKKPEVDNLTYERELPFDRLPYKERTDKYMSVGTAFLMTDGNFYTAYHVIRMECDSQFNEYFIRDCAEKVYKIKDIIKFSSNRDFLVFNAEGFVPEKGSGLEFAKNYKMNSTVFSAGNAQGEGIVIRNGLLTSETPENRKGEWNWLRFSAAANPGNSGGPLVNPEGKVIGIITMKNSTENLNFALPASEIANVADNTGIFRNELYYRLPNVLNDKFYHEFNYELKLPLPIEKVREVSFKENKRKTKEFFDTLTVKYNPSAFATAEINEALMNDFFSPSFPYTVALSENGKWSCYYPQKINTINLDNNSELKIGSMFGLIMAFLTKADNIKVEEYIQNQKLLMDNLAKGQLSRQVGTEKIAITSYGEPVSVNRHTDCYGRTWIASEFKLPFADYMILIYSLPLPDGIFTLGAITYTHDIKNGYNYDIPYLTDFVIPCYKGTTKEWTEFLAIPADIYPRPLALEDAQLDFNGKNGTTFSLGDFKGEISPKLTVIGDKDRIKTGIFFRENAGKIVQEISFVGLSGQIQTNNETFIGLNKYYAPPATARKAVKETYESYTNKTNPYDSQPHEDQTTTYIYDINSFDGYCTMTYLIQKGKRSKTIRKSLGLLTSKVELK